MESSSSSSSPIFPLARVKKIMKADSDVSNCSTEAVVLVELATELFLKKYSELAFEYCKMDKRKTVLYKDVAKVVVQDPRFAFLSEIIPQPVTLETILQIREMKGIREQNQLPSDSKVDDITVTSDTHNLSFENTQNNNVNSSTLVS